MNQSSNTLHATKGTRPRATRRRFGLWTLLVAALAFVLAACQTATPPPAGLTAGSPSFDGFGNTALTGSVLADATNATGAQADTVTFTDGSSVEISANGSFTYTPVAGSTGTKTFDFTVTDGTDTETGTATLNLAGMIWYVDDSVTATGSGISTAPFATIAEGVAAASSGEFVFVATGTYSADVELDSGVSLIGAGTDLVVGGNVAVAASTAPTINEGGDVSGAYITVNSDNTIAGFVIDGSATAGDVIGIANLADYGNRDTNVTISDNTFTSFAVTADPGDFTLATETAIRLEAVVGITFQGNTVTQITNPGLSQLSPLDLINVGGDIDISSNVYTGTVDNRLLFLATDGVTNLTVDANDFSPTAHPGARDGFFVSTNGGSALAASFTGNTFTDVGFVSLRLDVNGPIASSINAVVSNNVFDTAYIGVELDGGDPHQLTGLIENNTFTATSAESVLIDIDSDGGTASVDATVRNNTFTNVGVNNFADAIRAVMLGATSTSQSMRVLVDSNTVNGAGGAGLSADVTGGADTNSMSVTAVNNDFFGTNSNTGADSVVLTSNGSATLCVDADANDVTFDAGGAGSYLLAANDTSFLDVETGNTDQANIAADFAALQLTGTASVGGIGTVSEVADGTCAEPALPVVN